MRNTCEICLRIAYRLWHNVNGHYDTRDTNIIDTMGTNHHDDDFWCRQFQGWKYVFGGIFGWPPCARSQPACLSRAVGGSTVTNQNLKCKIHAAAPTTTMRNDDRFIFFLHHSKQQTTEEKISHVVGVHVVVVVVLKKSFIIVSLPFPYALWTPERKRKERKINSSVSSDVLDHHK